MKTAPTILMANESATPAVALAISNGVIAANSYRSDAKDNWVQLSPFGTFPNAQGIQQVTPEDARTICNEFNGVLSTGVRALGIPFYVGHPDHPAFKATYLDKAAKGRIKEMETRHDPACAKCTAFCNERSTEPCADHGLFGNVDWNPNGKTIIANQEYHGHSVNWHLRRNGANWHPFSLKSVGFTNEPCIPVAPITTANENNMNTLMDFVNKLLGTKYATNEEAEAGMTEMANSHQALKGSFQALAQKHAALAADHTDTMNALSTMVKKCGANEAITTAVTTVTAAGVKLPDEGIVTTLANEVVTLTGTAATSKTALDKATSELTLANEKVTTLTTEKETAQKNFVNERKARATDVLGTLVVGGFLTAAERATHETAFGDFANEVTFKTTMDGLLKLKPKLNVSSQVGALGRVNSEVQANLDLTTQVQTMVNEIMEKDDCDYMAAWEKAKSKAPALFAQMKQPEKPAAERAAAA